ncbi:hypothetical protein LguiA_001810 [Lonicera macranthoides]
MLELPNFTGLEHEKFKVPIRNWENLESLTLKSRWNTIQILREIDIHCKNFVSLSFKKTDIGESEALAIVTNVPNIKSLTLKQCDIKGVDLVKILKGCNRLSYFDISYCSVCNIDDSEMLELASRIATVKYIPPEREQTVFGDRLTLGACFRRLYELVKPLSFSLSAILAYKPPSENFFKRLSSVPLEDFIKLIPYFAPSSPLHTLALLMEHFTDPSQGQGIPPNTEQGSSVGDAPNPLAEVRSIEILDSEVELARICLPPGVEDKTRDIEKYTEAPGQEKRACYYKPGEVCFYEAAFEHGLRFPMDNHVRELLVIMDLAVAQVSPNMWSCLIGSMLISMAISARSHNITIEEFISFFQPKDSGGKNKDVFNCPIRSEALKIIYGLPDSIPN